MTNSVYIIPHKPANRLMFLFFISSHKSNNNKAKGLNRPLSSVYRKVVRMYDTRNYMGRYTKEEERRLLQLHRRHGASWIEIGEAMGRSAASVKDKIRLLKSDSNKGA